MSFPKAKPLILLILLLVLGTTAWWWLNPFALRDKVPQTPSSIEDYNFDERIILLRCVSKAHEEPIVKDLVTMLERWMKDDPHAQVRSQAVYARGLIASEHENKICPVSIAQALLDQDELVHQAACLSASMLKEFPPATIAVILNAAHTDDPEKRLSAMEVVGMIADRNKEARNIVLAARNDSNFHIRHNAHCQWFKLTGDLDIFLPYCMSIQAEFANLPPFKPDSPEKVQSERHLKLLIKMAMLLKIQKEGEERPDVVAAKTIECLGSDSELLRRGASATIGNLADEALRVRRKTALSKSGKPYTEEKRDEPQHDPVESPKLLERLLELNVAERLLNLERDDSCKAVRDMATFALKLWSELQQEKP